MYDYFGDKSFSWRDNLSPEMYSLLFDIDQICFSGVQHAN